jgi:anti-anti-sigma regulatory factor
MCAATLWRAACGGSFRQRVEVVAPLLRTVAMPQDSLPQIRRILLDAAQEHAGSDVVVLAVGREIGGVEAMRLHSRINRLVAAGDTCIVLDMNHMRTLSGSGIAMLMRAAAESSVAGGGIRIARLRAGHRFALALVGGDRSFRFFRSVKSAVASFSAGDESS